MESGNVLSLDCVPGTVLRAFHGCLQRASSSSVWSCGVLLLSSYRQENCSLVSDLGEGQLVGKLGVELEPAITWPLLQETQHSV